MQYEREFWCYQRRLPHNGKPWAIMAIKHVNTSSRPAMWFDFIVYYGDERRASHYDVLGYNVEFVVNALVDFLFARGQYVDETDHEQLAYFVIDMMEDTSHFKHN